MTMTPDAKAHLARTVRDLRLYLLGEVGDSGPPGVLHDAAESEYRFPVRVQDAGLGESARARRKRLEGWLAEQARAAAAGKNGGRKARRTAESFRRDVEKQTGYTLLNRLVILRLMEASGLRKPALVTSGWESRAYKDFRELAQTLVGDEAEGFGFLIGLVFDDLAIDLPGLYGSAGVADLVPITAPVWRRCIEALDDPRLTSCWTDDMTLGWVYQYWNDPEREALDAKLNAGGKVEPHEIASKTQMFTERYMVDWLLQNSLGPMWLAMCRKHGWTPEVESSGTLAALEERRVEWRRKREAGEVSLTDLMPLHGTSEEHWAYYVPQPIPDHAVANAPETVREMKILDPAVGSGHFLVVAFDLLIELYREEARHRSEADQTRWSDQAVVESILENNLHGIDLDPRSIQMTAAALWLKARKSCPTAQPKRLNVVATNLGLGTLPENDATLVDLRREIEQETGIPANLTETIVHALKGADHLGSLLKVDAAVEAAIRNFGEEQRQPLQGDLFTSFGDLHRVTGSVESKREDFLELLERFLARHSGGDDLGLRLQGEQLAAGVRFLRLLRESSHDLVVANPPYQDTSKITEGKLLDKTYKKAKGDLFAAFIMRGLQLTKPGGVSAMLTMRSWMFAPNYIDFRAELLERSDLRVVGDFDRGAFQEIVDEQVSVAVAVFRKSEPATQHPVAIRPSAMNDRSRDGNRTLRKRAATLCQEGRFEFAPATLKVVPNWPLVYWWGPEFLSAYKLTPKLGSRFPIRYGLSTQDNTRWLRRAWEIDRGKTMLKEFTPGIQWDGSTWVPYVKGAGGRKWLDEVSDVIHWRLAGCEMWAYPENRWGRGTDYYFKRGVAFVNIGAAFSARAFRKPGIFGHVAGSVFDPDTSRAVCLLNSTRAQYIAESLNPSMHFLTSDVARLPLLPTEQSQHILEKLETVFTLHEAARECSVEFRRPGPSPWRYAQEWAQDAVDRPQGAPLPLFKPVYDPESPTERLSFALGTALGRFGANCEGILDPAKADLSETLPSGLLFLDGTLEENDRHDSLGHPAAALLHTEWEKHGHAIGPGVGLRDYLRTRFFADVHRKMYENRPIHWPLSSEKKTFVAWINIHRWHGGTLLKLLADHLYPSQRRFEGEQQDLQAARDSADRKASKAAENQLEKLRAARSELETFINNVLQCAEKGPLPTDSKCTPREVDARYAPDLDDGVMINSAALWPLLEWQWKDPKKWWKELANAEGKKDYDWSHLAMRYWPTRVNAKCQKDPSLGVAHGCFWKYHPGRAWAWELRLQDEIGPDFRIEEAPYRGDEGDVAHRAAYLAGQLEGALATVESEALRRRRKHKKLKDELHLLESGLWSEAPRPCWDLEIRIAERQGREFFLRAPDEPEARAAFEAANPERASERRQIIQSLSERGLFQLAEDVDKAEIEDNDGPPDEDDDP